MADGFTLEFLENCTHRYSRQKADFAAFKPVSAPTSALTSGQGLRLVEPGKVFGAALRIRIQA